MGWLSLLSGAFSFLNGIIKLFERMGLISQGRAQATLQSLEKQNDRIQTAKRARLYARRTNNADGLYDDDGQKRD